MDEGRSSFKMLTGGPTGKRPSERSKRRSQNNIRIDLQEIGINTNNLLEWAQDGDYWRAFVNAALNFRVS